MTQMHSSGDLPLLGWQAIKAEDLGEFISLCSQPARTGGNRATFAEPIEGKHPEAAQPKDDGRSWTMLA